MTAVQERSGARKNNRWRSAAANASWRLTEAAARECLQVQAACTCTTRDGTDTHGVLRGDDRQLLPGGRRQRGVW